MLINLLQSPEYTLIPVSLQMNAITINPFVYNLSSNPGSTWMYPAYSREGHIHLSLKCSHLWGETWQEFLHRSTAENLIFFFSNKMKPHHKSRTKFSHSLSSYTGKNIVFCSVSVLIFERRFWANYEYVVLNFSKGSQSIITFLLPGDRMGEPRCKTIQRITCSSQLEVMWQSLIIWQQI